MWIVQIDSMFITCTKIGDQTLGSSSCGLIQEARPMFFFKNYLQLQGFRTLKTCQMPQVFSFLNPIALKLGGFIPATDIFFYAVVGDADLVFKEEFCEVK